jgi:hypothetical protein
MIDSVRLTQPQCGHEAVLAVRQEIISRERRVSAGPKGVAQSPGVEY